MFVMMMVWLFVFGLVDDVLLIRFGVVCCFGFAYLGYLFGFVILVCVCRCSVF